MKLSQSHNRKMTKGRIKAGIENGVNPNIQQLQKQQTAARKRREKDVLCLNARNFGESLEDYENRMKDGAYTLHS